MRLTDDQRRDLQSACDRAAPREACGIIAGGVVYELPNHASECGTFHLKAADANPILRKAGRLDAVWHTHPSGDPLPSESDVADHPFPAALVIATRSSVTVYTDATEALAAARS